MKLGSTLGSVLLVALVGSFVGIVACGESDEEKAAAEKRKQEEAELAEQDKFLDTYCAIILPCCNKILQAQIDDVAGCKAHLREIDPVSIADKAARAACLEQSRAAAPAPNFCTDFQHMLTPACPDPSRKNQKNATTPEADAGVRVGEVCNTVEDCAVDFSGIVDCAQGICQLRKHGAEGDGPCDTTIDGDVVLKVNENDPVAEGVVFTCYRKEGTQCDSKSRTCVAPFGDREKCTPGGTECEKTHFCDKNEKRCFPKYPKGSVCSEDIECKGHCVAREGKGGDDDDDDDDGDLAFGDCADPVGEDEDCGTTGWCEDGLECISGKCTKPGPDARLGNSCKL